MNDAATLLVDIGNTNLKWTMFAGGIHSETKIIGYRQLELAGLLATEWHDLRAPQRVLVASVGGARVTDALCVWVREHWAITPQILQSSARAMGVSNAYTEPEALGIDRWLGLIAVHRQTDLPAVIVDCGTAITLDLLLANGNHLGGLILPGLELMPRALYQGTNIPPQNLPRETNHLGTDTAGAISSGCAQAVAALTERVTDDFSLQLGVDPVIVMTGSDAPRVEPLLHRSVRYEPDLVMRGLISMAERE